MSASLWDEPAGQLRARVSSASPTPGGGAVAAISAAFAVALLRMICRISLNKLAEAECGDVGILLAQLTRCEESLARSADEDVRAFDAYMGSRKSDAQDELDELLLRCADVPLTAAEIVSETQSLLPQIESICPPFARSDLTTATCLLLASRESLLANVKTNLDAMREEMDKFDIRARYDLLMRQADARQ